MYTPYIAHTENDGFVLVPGHLSTARNSSHRANQALVVMQDFLAAGGKEMDITRNYKQGRLLHKCKLFLCQPIVSWSGLNGLRPSMDHQMYCEESIIRQLLVKLMHG